MGYKPRFQRDPRIGNLRGPGALDPQLGMSPSAIQREILQRPGLARFYVNAAFRHMKLSSVL